MKKFVLSMLLSTLAFAGDAQCSADVVTEQSRPVKSWGATLIEREYCVPDSDVCSVDLLLERPVGTKRLLARGLVGYFVVLERSQVVFSCEANAILETRGPILIRLNGSTTNVTQHPGYLRTCGATGTGEEILLVYNMMERGNPYNLVRVVGSSGKLIVEKRLDTSGNIEFKIFGKNYYVQIPAPEFPG